MQELQRSRQIIHSRLQGAPAHAAHAWPATGGAAPADDLRILMPEFDGRGLQLGGLLQATSPPGGRKRGWASLAGDDAWPAQQAQRPQHGGPRVAQGLVGWSPALAEEGLWAQPQAPLPGQQRQAGGLDVLDPGDLGFDLSGEGSGGCFKLNMIWVDALRLRGVVAPA